MKRPVFYGETSDLVLLPHCTTLLPLSTTAIKEESILGIAKLFINTVPVNIESSKALSSISPEVISGSKLLGVSSVWSIQTRTS